MKLAILALLLCGFTALGQSPGSKTNPTKHRELPSHKENVYSDSWDSGEIKDCSTFSGKPYLLVCDDTKISWPESFINIAGGNERAGMSKDQAYEHALTAAMSRSKTFVVKFFDDKGRDPEPWPEPQTGLKMAAWQCTKDTTISCSFVGREN